MPTKYVKEEDYNHVLRLLKIAVQYDWIGDGKSNAHKTDTMKSIEVEIDKL